MASTKKVTFGRNYVQLISFLSIFLEFFASFVGCSLCLFKDYSKKND